MNRPIRKPSPCSSAESAFDEGLLIPPVKIVEGGVIRRDIEELYLRSSRKPQMVALDFRAQLAGNNSARRRVHELIERYGFGTDFRQVNGAKLSRDVLRKATGPMFGKL